MSVLRGVEVRERSCRDESPDASPIRDAMTGHGSREGC